VLLRVPSLDGVLVALVQQEPLLLATVGPLKPDQDEAATQLVPEDLGVQLAGRHRGCRVVGAVRLPRPGIPHDHVATAVLPGRDHPLEVQVLDRVVLDVHGVAPRRRVECRSLRDGPAHQHPVDLEAQVVVQAAGPVALDDEPWSGPGGPGGAASRFRRAVEVPHTAVARKARVVGHGPPSVGLFRIAPRRPPAKRSPRVARTGGPITVAGVL
jgi:hypothetical protein